MWVPFSFRLKGWKCSMLQVTVTEEPTSASKINYLLLPYCSGEEEDPLFLGPLLPGPARDTPWGPHPAWRSRDPSEHQGAHCSGK